MYKLIKQLKTVSMIVLFSLFSGLVFAQTLKIEPEEIELTVGDTLQVEAVFIDSNENEIDTSVVWTVDPHQLATVNSKGILVAKNEGEGVLIATLDELSDTVDLLIDPMENGQDDVLLPAVEIVQGDMEMYVGDTLQYSVVYIDTNEVQTDTVGVWNLRPDSLGALDSTSGQFIAARPGEGLVEVYVGELMAWAKDPPG